MIASIQTLSNQPSTTVTLLSCIYLTLMCWRNYTALLCCTTVFQIRRWIVSSDWAVAWAQNSSIWAK